MPYRGANVPVTGIVPHKLKLSKLYIIFAARFMAFQVNSHNRWFELSNFLKSRKACKIVNISLLNAWLVCFVQKIIFN